MGGFRRSPRACKSLKNLKRQDCHGRGRGFEPRRPRQILKDLSPIWHVTLRYKIVQHLKATGNRPLGHPWKTQFSRLNCGACYASPQMAIRPAAGLLWCRTARSAANHPHNVIFAHRMRPKRARKPPHLWIVSAEPSPRVFSSLGWNVRVKTCAFLRQVSAYKMALRRCSLSAFSTRSSQASSVAQNRGTLLFSQYPRSSALSSSRVSRLRAVLLCRNPW